MNSSRAFTPSLQSGFLRYRTVLFFLLPHNQHVRKLIQSRLTDFVSDLFRTAVHRAQDTVISALYHSPSGHILVFLRNREAHAPVPDTTRWGTCLHAFNQPGQCSFIAADRCPVDDIRALFLPVRINIGHIKPFSQEHIQLDCDHRIFLAVYVL